MARYLLLVATVTLVYTVAFGATADTKKDAQPDARLGLLASSLGVPPVPGASYGGSNAAAQSTSYTGGYVPDGGNYGPVPAPVKNCKCTPKAYCLDSGASSGVVQPGPTYGENAGNPGPSYGGNGGNTGPTYGGNGGNTGPSYGGNGGNPGPSYGDNGGVVGPSYGDQGNKSPSYGGGLVDPGYQGGHDGGNGAGIISGGTDQGLKPSYGAEGLGTDGAGVIDIRIVNKPPGGNVACLSGEVYCCNRNEGGTGTYPSGPQVDPSYPSSPSTCGVRSIIPVPGFKPEYGQAQFGSYPWMVVILGPNNNYIGAGALLDNYNVLTAAHKIAEFKGNFKIRLGEWNAQADDEPFKNVEVDVARVEIHPAFNSQNLQNDVAIIKLAQPVSLDAYPHIKSACLPSHGANFVGSRCWVAGFGKDAFQVGKHSYILREVDVPVIDSNECEQRLRGTRLGNYFNLNRKSFLCAGGEEGKDACTGDGGSPLVCEYNGKFNVVGLVAWGIGCAEYGIPGVYVNVGNYVNWIQSQLSQTQDQDLAGYARAKPPQAAY